MSLADRVQEVGGEGMVELSFMKNLVLLAGATLALAVKNGGGVREMDRAFLVMRAEMVEEWMDLAGKMVPSSIAERSNGRGWWGGLRRRNRR